MVKSKEASEGKGMLEVIPAVCSCTGQKRNEQMLQRRKGEGGRKEEATI